MKNITLLLILTIACSHLGSEELSVDPRYDAYVLVLSRPELEGLFHIFDKMPEKVVKKIEQGKGKQLESVLTKKLAKTHFIYR